MDYLALIGNLSPRLERAVDALVEVETVAAELGRTTRGKTFLVRGPIHWTGMLSMHRVLYDDAFFLLDSVSESLEPHHHASWTEWRSTILRREVVLESLLPDAAAEDGDKQRIHRRWRSDRVDVMRASVLKRMFGDGDTPVPLRQRVEELAGRLHMQRGHRSAAHTFAPGSPRTLGASATLSTAEVRIALGFLSATFNDISVLSEGVVRTYGGPENRESLELEARCATDAIVLGDVDHLAAARGRMGMVEASWHSVRDVYYAALHTAHDTGHDANTFLFNDLEIEMRVGRSRSQGPLRSP